MGEAKRKMKIDPSAANKPREHILKIQRPLYSSDPRPKILVYNRSRTIEFTAENATLLETMRQNDLAKIYVRAVVTDDTIDIKEALPEQDW